MYLPSTCIYLPATHGILLPPEAVRSGQYNGNSSDVKHEGKSLARAVKAKPTGIAILLQPEHLSHYSGCQRKLTRCTKIRQKCTFQCCQDRGVSIPDNDLVQYSNACSERWGPRLTQMISTIIVRYGHHYMSYPESTKCRSRGLCSLAYGCTHPHRTCLRRSTTAT